jgi:hypothetical protein
MGLSTVRSDQPAQLYAETIRASLRAVLGLWLARRLVRLILLIVRSPSAVIGITVATADNQPDLLVGGTAVKGGERSESPATPKAPLTAETETKPSHVG